MGGAWLPQLLRPKVSAPRTIAPVGSAAAICAMYKRELGARGARKVCRLEGGIRRSEECWSAPYRRFRRKARGGLCEPAPLSAPPDLDLHVSGPARQRASRRTLRPLGAKIAAASHSFVSCSLLANVDGVPAACRPCRPLLPIPTAFNDMVDTTVTN